ncbi:hypothetical protein BH11ACT2_BH11ACT2_10900 [soil metagenome]
MTYSALMRNGILHSSDYLRTHKDIRDLTTAVNRGQLVKLRRGAYADAGEWADLDERGKHLLRVRAVLAAAREERPLAGFSAAAVWKMWVSEFPADVTLLDRWKGGGRSEPGVRRISAAFDSAATYRVDGLLVTSIARTALDVARSTDFTRAIGSLDWALWHKNPWRISHDALFGELEKLPLSVGRRHLETCIRFASPLSDSFGESFGRALMFELGYEAPEQQAKFPAPNGSYFVDYFWRRLGLIGEFDGKGKYLNDNWNGRDPGEAVWKEKKREDDLRSQGNSFVRIFWADLLNPALLVAKLDRAGVPRGRR